MRGPLVLVLVAGIGVFAVFTRMSQPTNPVPEVGTAGAEATGPAAPGASTAPMPEPDEATLAALDLPVVKVYKSPTCGCCVEWAAHLREHGFEVEEVDTDDMFTVKAALGVPSDLGSCHTAEVGDYLVEGHVPADDIKRILALAPDARGLSVPGMPVGSPGMEVPGQPADRYDVIVFNEDGSRRVWRSY